MTNISKAIYGLIGYPLGHSLSPIIHNTAFNELKVDAEYILIPTKKDELEAFFKDLRRPDNPIFGLNVTIPYKEDVIPLLDKLDPFAAKVGAVNTIVISNDRQLTGHNTDGPGFLAHLTDIGFNPGGKRISIIGAGGAARALLAVFSLITDRPESILIYDIDQPKAQNLLADLGKRLDTHHIKVVKSLDDLNIELADLLVNATPIGLKAEDPSLVTEEHLHPHLTVYDLIYNPSETPLLKTAKKRGAKTVNGLRMLFYQGVLAFQHWADAQISEKVKRRMWAELEKASLKH
jgi:shikimate dehydrogenase